MLAVSWFLDLADWRKNLRGDRKPMEGIKLLRGPGEHIRAQRAALLEKAACYAAFLFAGSAFAIASIRPAHDVIASARVEVAVVFQLFCAVQLYRLVMACQRLNLGLQGEIAVAEELNQFLREGCYVFHDIPEKSIGNIDHVLVGPTGVFVIETKARSKRRAAGNESKIEYDGHRLRFPDGFETDNPIKQARRNAVWLRKALAADLAEDVQVRAIVCYPGWFVRDRPGEKWDVKVRNPQRVNNVVRNERSKLPDQQMQRIERWLDARCRTIEI